MKLLLTFLFAILAVGVLVSGFVNGVSAQTLCANGRVVAPCEEIDTTVQGSLSNDKGFSVGQSLASCLIAECPIYTGVIKTVNIDKDKDVVYIGIHVSQRLSGVAADDLNEFQFNVGLHFIIGHAVVDSFDVRLEPGSELMFTKCPSRIPTLLILGNANYFLSVRSTIIFNGANDLRQNFEGVLAPLKDQTDNVFAGYVASSLSHLAAASKLDEHLDVLMKVFSDSNFPPQGVPFIAEGIRSILVRENRHPSNATRDNAIRKLIQVGSSNDKEMVGSAIMVLEGISGKEWFRPERYVDRISAQKLIQNLHNITTSADRPGALVTKLSKIN